MLTLKRLAIVPAFGLLVTFILAGWTFIMVMHDGTMTIENAIEAGSFAAQTVTTVGYGNWETPAVKPAVQLPHPEERLLQNDIKVRRKIKEDRLFKEPKMMEEHIMRLPTFGPAFHADSSPNMGRTD